MTLSKSTISRATSQHMTAVHALGQPASPPPQTRWAQPAHGRAGQPPVTTKGATTHIPNTPGAVSLAQGAGSDLTVIWPAPAIDATHDAATGYALRSRPSGAATWTMVLGVASPYDLSGLAAGAPFDVQIQSSNAAGASSWSAISTLATAAAGPYAPGPPAIATIAPPPDGTNTKLTIAWTPPAVDGTHGAATGFNVRFRPSGAGNWTMVSGVTSPYTITGLTGATALDIEVQATNAAASPGTWSAVLSGTTWSSTVVPGNWVAAASQVHGASVAPNGGAQMTATGAPTPVTGAVFAWSASNSVVPATGLIAAGSDGQNNGWGQYFNAPTTTGTFYLWMLAQGGGGGATIGALVTTAITVS